MTTFVWSFISGKFVATIMFVEIKGWIGGNGALWTVHINIADILSHEFKWKKQSPRMIMNCSYLPQPVSSQMLYTVAEVKSINLLHLRRNENFVRNIYWYT